jgi:hypothetical protein
LQVSVLHKSVQPTLSPLIRPILSTGILFDHSHFWAI